MISIQTNVDSLIAQSNLNVDDNFQSNTIQQLTSGYRINKSGDDAAGLAVANGYQSQIAELTQGVNNANDGVSQLQIVDGGLSNISTILNRLKTLATESASSTFTGNRSTLNNEYSGLLSDISRQATNVNLTNGGSFNTNLSVFIGGGSDTGTTNTVGINLSGESNAVDATSLGLTGTNVLGGGVGFTGNTTRLDQTGETFLAAAATEVFAFNLYSGGAQTVNVTVTGTTAGISGSDVLSQLNSALSTYGINATTTSDGTLQFSGAAAFNVTDSAATPALISTTATPSATNGSNYDLLGKGSYTAPAEDILSVQTGSTTQLVTLASATNAADLTSAIATINGKTASLGVYAIAAAAGGIEFQSANSFSVNESTSGAFTDGVSTFHSATGPTTASTNNATSAITAIDTAINNLGLVQGVVGAGENKLQYAINLAQSQITNVSSAESAIKDADIAAEAANLSKSQVLTQTAIAALAQANAEPQAVLKLLQ